MSHTINFSHDWNNKLYCKFFTTIRLKNDFLYQVGTQYDIAINSKSLGPGIIRDIKDFKLAQLTPIMAMLDTGYELEDCKGIFHKMYKNKNVNWDTQLLSFILIEQPFKRTISIDPLLFYPYTYPNQENEHTKL
ncbi:hypothetical protein IDJ77_11345 [Mucilaginibacter sp. ZT4R22]|uniref:Uncharacterized protein n=1 Tax=Mucilaginibacter pankratovii TaxID=2772110 RepID=A0ABR7WQ01_9SPHI|nr:hypothetical protein [Mucilaginibacter pankratovii]MBD1364404.1 hypothetical protein [Mucilaginibacter pankratovii]